MEWVGGVKDCCKFAPAGAFYFGVLQDGSVGLFGLNKCHRRSSCPVCAIGRDVEDLNRIQYAIHEARKRNWGVYLVTFTFSHCLADTLDDLQARYSWANEQMYRNGSYRKDLKYCLGYHGRITDYEVQLCGENGYHPHRHELFFCEEGLELDFFEWIIRQYYLKALSESGLSAREDIGVKVDGYQGVGNYITKMSAEITLGNHTKESWDGSSLSPFRCLQMWHETREKFYASWWCDYVCHIRGKRKLGWSRGLKDLLGVREFVDELTSDNVLYHPFVIIPGRDSRRFPLWKWREMSEEINGRCYEDVLEELNRIQILYDVDEDGLKIYEEW